MNLTRRDERIQAAFWRYVQATHLGASDEIEDAFAAGWLAGGKQVLHDSARIAELLPLLREIQAWFEVDA